MLNRRFFIAALGIAAGNPVSRLAFAADWPSRPVRVLYPYSAGSSGDVTARLISGRLGDHFRKPFLVENRTGANGIVATAEVARSTPDGYTLLWAITPQIAIAPAMQRVSYDPIKDFLPISAVCTTSFALVVNTQVPVKTLAEFVEYARVEQSGFTYAEGGIGSLPHLAMALFLHRVGLNGTNVSYKGTEPALLDVVAGRVPAMFALLGDAMTQAASGQIRILAVSGERRSLQVPDIPTIAESGYPGFKATSWWGLLAPAGTSRSVADAVAAEVLDTLKDEDIQRHLSQFGVEPLGSDPDQFAEMISADIILWAEAVKIAGIRP